MTPKPAIDPSEVAYRMSFEPHPKPIRVTFNGETVADSAAVMVLRETRLPPVFYFPRADVRMDLLQRTDRHTHCPFKGNATYWTLAVGDRRAENAVWGYEHPLADVGDLADHVAFYWRAMDAWFEDGAPLAEPASEAGAGGNPFVDFVLREAWSASSTADLVARLSACLVAAGIRLVRLRLLLRTLHPQLFATAYTWRRDGAQVEEFRVSHELLHGEDHLQSPYAPILDGAGGVRRRLDGPEPLLDFPILRTLQAEGATDYVAMPLLFSDGQINILSLVVDAPGGFSVRDLGLVHEVMPVLSRLFEVHALRRTAVSLLDTYLGTHTGERVLNGYIKRGDGEDLHAVIWFSDLRGSTALTESMRRDQYLVVLNEFFDATAGAVLEHGGEVLKFIGDAVLAIFLITGGDAGDAEARAAALRAARAARERIEALNAARAASGGPVIAFGVGLHVGSVTYGNVGTPGRLDFTVIGSAANEAARIESMCKTEGRWILLSAEFARACSDALVAVGQRVLRGVSAPQELFTLAD